MSPFVTLGLFIFDLSVYSTPQLRMPIVSERIFFSYTEVGKLLHEFLSRPMFKFCHPGTANNHLRTTGRLCEDVGSEVLPVDGPGLTKAFVNAMKFSFLTLLTIPGKQTC